MFVTKMYKQILFISVSFFHLITASKAPFIKKCLASDSQCITQSAKEVLPLFAAGIPEFGVETMDPLFIKIIDASAPDLRLIFKNITITGLKEATIHKIERDEQNKKIHLSVECTADLYGKFDILGKILLIEIQGQGDAHIKLRRMAFDITGDVIEKIGNDGNVYLNVKSLKYTYKLKDKADIDLDNLFNENGVLDTVVHELLRTNANDIVLEVGPPIVKAIMNKLVGNIKNFFEAVPSEDFVIV